MIDGDVQSVRCPEEHELLALAAGEELDHWFRSHVESCEACAQRINRLSAEVLTLQLFVAEASDTCASTSLADPERGILQQPGPEQTNPEQIGRYRVISRLGTGGQADVYRVVHPNLEQELVLKLSRRATLPGIRDRLVREGQVLARLNHPNMARIVDLDVHDGRAYLVMEYVRGRNLRQHFTARAYSPVEAASLIARVARALGPAHACGVLHLDLKPENVVIGQDGELRVIDFGLMMLRDAWDLKTGDPGEVSGTVEYMPPEQANGDTEKFGPQTDIFSIGAMLYELLTGEPPYWGGTRMERWERAKACSFDHEALKRAGIAAPLEQLCLKAMAREPGDRQASVAELADSLERFSRRRWRLGGWIAATVIFVAALITASAWPSLRVDMPLQNLLRVETPNGAFEPDQLAACIPLRTDWSIQVKGDIPPMMNAALFWYDSNGKLSLACTSEYETMTSSKQPWTLVYPDPGASKRLVPPAGVEMALLCATKARLPREDLLEAEMRGIFAQVLADAPLPRIPTGSALRFDNDEAVGRLAATNPSVFRPLGETEEGQLAEAEARLERLRGALNKRFDYFAGIAFRHVD